MISRQFPQTGWKRKAFTIVEVLVVATIIVFLLTAIYRLLAGSKKNFIQGGHKLTIQLTGQNLLEYIKTDLIQSCRLNDNDEILKINGDTYSFYRFNPEIGKASDAVVEGAPVPEKITYAYDSSGQTLTRSEERVAYSILKAGKSEKIAEHVKSFQIQRYTLNQKNYFRIEFQLFMTKEETRGTEEEITIVTSMESRFENNDSENATWWNNKHTKIVDVSGELPIW
jgi:hypothetical protein